MSDLVEQADREMLCARMSHLRLVSTQGYFDKQFIAHVCPRDPSTLTIRQMDYILKLVWKYRRQMPARLIPAAQPVYEKVVITRRARRKPQIFKKSPQGQETLL